MASGSESTALLAVVDLDGLKTVNDTEGHLAGDVLLRVTAETLRQAIRTEDVLARVGGDDFHVMAVDYKPPVAAVPANRLRAALDGEDIPASIGAAVRAPNESLAEAVHRADQAMYDDKTPTMRWCLTPAETAGIPLARMVAADLLGMTPAADTVMAELDGVLAAIGEARVRMTLIESRAAEIRARRDAGKSYSEIVPSEQQPLVVELLAETIKLLHDASGRFRREEARALHAEGFTMDEIASLFGVTRQRISEVLKPRCENRPRRTATTAPAGR